MTCVTEKKETIEHLSFRIQSHYDAILAFCQNSIRDPKMICETNSGSTISILDSEG
jgi:hypothetical protein